MTDLAHRGIGVVRYISQVIMVSYYSTKSKYFGVTEFQFHSSATYTRGVAWHHLNNSVESPLIGSVEMVPLRVCLAA